MLTSLKQKITGSQVWLKQNWVLALIAVGGIWWLFPASSINGPDLTRSFNSSVQSLNYATDSMESVSSQKSARNSLRMPVANANDFDPTQTDRKVIKSGSLQIEVPTPDTLRATVEDTVESLEAYVSDLNSWEVRSGVLAYNFTIRVSAEKFETALTELAKLGTKKSESFNEQDITSQYQDTEAQIANLVIRRDGLRTLMENRTEVLADLLAVDRELSQVQQQIEQLERTQQSRDNQVSYSVINLTVQPEPQIGDVANPNWSVDRSWRQSVNELIVAGQDIADRAIKALVFTPIWLPLLILFLIGRRFWKKRKK